MSYQSIALAALGAWLVIGFALGVVMQRRGYSGFGWGVVGMVLGPIGVLVALFVHVAPKSDETIAFGIAGGGPVDVLVGIDGSDVSLAAAVAAAEVLGPRLGRYTLAAVEPLDATPEEEASGHAALEAARSAAADGSLRLVGVRPGAVLLHGRPADALRRYAQDEGYEALAIGSHGRGGSKALLGSAAAALLRSSPLPIIVSGVAVRPAGSRHAATTASAPA